MDTTTAWTTTAPGSSDDTIAINNAADISVIVIYFIVVLAVGLWVGLVFSPLLPAWVVRVWIMLVQKAEYEKQHLWEIGRGKL